MSFFDTLLASAKNALAVAQPVISAAEVIAPMVAKAFPQTAPVINAVEAGAASIEAVGPGVADSVMKIIAEGESIMANASPELKKMEAVFAALFHHTATPQAVVLTPAASAATVPSKAPAAAKTAAVAKPAAKA